MIKDTETVKVPVAPLSDIPENGTRKFVLHGKSVLVARTPAGVFAIENRCSHALQALEGGKLRGFHIFCPAHGVRFDMRDGSAMGRLTKLPIIVWDVEIIDDVIYIGMGVE
ncbi:Rieske 2Fe-2S domain-containing protein [Sphingorhabdus sp.]|uniref:Rieske (2Fe-2S) protein n=1 Tax=Sphingorhabdus sp. TaxID=1902408 RepID=UPI0026218222|nr:Rieske 2Fe-2S domain-containing protein [Sphingorhabdus sp.]MDH4398212.1 Rieske 2Fe-2S domain-containing protein [Sphingorhabdus sp.]